MGPLIGSSEPEVVLPTIGMLGGMSWESTLLYYRLMNQQIRTRYAGTLHSCPILLHSFDLEPLAQLQRLEEWEAIGEILGNAAKALVNSGADAVMLACNTMHICSKRIEEISGLKLLHIVDFTADAVVAAGKKRIALLGTRWTMEKDYFKGRLRQSGLEVLTPLPEDMEAIHNIIFEELNNGIIRPESKVLLIGVINGMIERGADGLILGCTELSLLLKADDVGVASFDTTEIHANGAAEWVSARAQLSNVVERHL